MDFAYAFDEAVRKMPKWGYELADPDVSPGDLLVGGQTYHAAGIPRLLVGQREQDRAQL
jgi:hypothetical protein